MSAVEAATARRGAQTTAECRHCGAVFRPREERDGFCCAGCEYVYRLITGQKLDRFYQLRRGASAPVRPVVFQPRDYRWLEGLVKRAEAAAGSGAEATLEMDVQGISCVGCVWLIDRLFRDREGARRIQINSTLGRMTISWAPGGCGIVEFARELQRFGYLVGPASKQARRESGALVLRLGLCAAFAMNGMLFAMPAYLGMEPDFPFAGLFTLLSFFFATASLVVGGGYFFKRSWRALRRGVMHIDLPISLGILVGYAGSIYAWSQAAGEFIYFEFVSTFSFLMIVGRWTQLAALERNRNRLLGLSQDLPAVDLIEDQTEADGHRSVSSKAASALEPGDRFLVGPGQVIPVSSSLLGPAASIGLDWISGESEARAVAPGQIVESGAINLGTDNIRLQALEGWGTSLLARLFAVQPPSEWRNRTLERVIRVYLFSVLAVAALGGAAWAWRTGDVAATLQVVVSVLVISCPCALGVTLPLIDELAVARLRHSGVFVRAGDLWARLRKARKVVFDKTGTLTLESLVLKNRADLRALSPEARGALGSLVQASRHPVAACIREALLAAGFQEAAPADVTTARVYEEIGYGLEWRDEWAVVWRLGRAAWAAPGETGSGAAADAVFSRDGVVVARFAVGEEIREDAVAEIAKMRARGLSVFILSGDHATKVAAMAKRLGLPDSAATGAMSPSGKAEWVRAIDRGDTLMIGDGANDTLAFAAASCRGTPAVERGLLEHRSDFYFLGRGLAGINRLIEAATIRHRTTLRVLGFAIVYNVIMVCVALSGAMNPLLAAIVMPASAVLSLAIAAFGMRRV